MKTVVAIMVLLLVAQTTSPQISHTVPPGTDDNFSFTSGNALLRKCQDTDEKPYCLAYIVGVVDMVGALQGSQDLERKSYWKYNAVCLPTDVESGQIRDVIVKYLVDHPEKRDERAAQLIIIRLVETWKCPRASAAP